MKIYTDGSGKTGKYCFFVDQTHELRLFQKDGITNNESEYLAIIQTLKIIDNKNISIYSDSQLIVNQLNKKWKIKEKRLKILAEQVWSLSRDRNINFVWIPREQNIAGKILERYSK